MSFMIEFEKRGGGRTDTDRVVRRRGLFEVLVLRARSDEKTW